MEISLYEKSQDMGYVRLLCLETAYHRITFKDNSRVVGNWRRNRHHRDASVTRKKICGRASRVMNEGTAERA